MGFPEVLIHVSEKTNESEKNKIVEKRKLQEIYLQVGGGTRSFEDAATLLGIGVDTVILRTAALKDPELIKRLSDEFGSEHINVALDSKNGKISIEGWTKESEHTAVEMGSQFEEKGAGSILFTNIDSEGLLNGVDPKPTEALVNAVTIPVIASGGGTTLEDIVTLKNTGATGVVIGSALDKKKFTLTEAINIISDEN